jgi:lysophospholipase L1-like esterase
LFRSSPWLWILALLAAGLALCALEMLRESWVARKVEALSGAGPIGARCAPFARPAEGARPRLYLIGDSGMSRWPPGLIDADWDVVNCGMGGETTAHLVRRIDNFDFVRPNDVVLIAAGVNDLVAASFLDPAAADKAIEQTSQHLSELAQAAGVRARLVLLATLVPPSRPSLIRLPVWKESLREFVALVNGKTRMTGGNGKIAIVDFAAALDSNDRRTPEAFRHDTLHLNASGYSRLAKTLNKALPPL